VARDPETLDISDRVGVERDGAIRCKSKRPRRHAGASTRNNNETKRWPTPRRSGGRVSLGRLAECDDMLTGVEWRHGFIRSARVSYTHERFNNERPQVSIEQALGTLRSLWLRAGAMQLGDIVLPELRTFETVT